MWLYKACPEFSESQIFQQFYKVVLIMLKVSKCQVKEATTENLDEYLVYLRDSKVLTKNQKKLAKMNNLDSENVKTEKDKTDSQN
jgi:hypothetical protein